MAVQKRALPFALAWFLLAGPFLMGQVASSPCKQHHVRDHKRSLETLKWQEACLPLAVILGGCCGVVWWVLLIIYDVSQKGGQKGLPQISGEVELEELKTTTLDRQEERTKAGIKLDREAAGKENVEPGPCPPSQPGRTMFWAYLEQELERILLAVRCYQIIKQSPVAEERNTVTTEKPGHLAGDWQNFLAEMKRPRLTFAEQSSLPAGKQQLQTGEGPSSLHVDKQQPLTGEGPSAPPENKRRPRSRERKRSPAKEKKKSPNRARSRSRKKSSSPSSRSRGCGSRCCSGCRRWCVKHK